MHKIVIQILAAFIPNKEKRKEFRKKFRQKYKKNVHCPIVNTKDGYNIVGENNKIICVIDGQEKLLSNTEIIQNLNIQIEGSNNIIKIHFPITIVNSIIQISGDFNEFYIESSIYQGICNTRIDARHFGQNRKLKIGKNFTIHGSLIRMDESDTEIIIGNDCMFSHDLFFRQGDGHPIIDADGNILNKATKMIIGDHVWIGAYSMLLKDVYIPSGCIIGARSLVTKKFTSNNCVIAGHPAKVVKENINWLRYDMNEYDNILKKQRKE